MNSLTKQLNVLAEKLGKFHISDEPVVHKITGTAKTAFKSASKKTLKRKTSTTKGRTLKSAKLTRANIIAKRRRNSMVALAKRRKEEALLKRRETLAKRKEETKRKEEEKKAENNTELGKTRSETKKIKTMMKID